MDRKKKFLRIENKSKETFLVIIALYKHNI